MLTEQAGKVVTGPYHCLQVTERIPVVRGTGSFDSKNSLEKQVEPLQQESRCKGTGTRASHKTRGICALPPAAFNPHC